jgi:hypothetical protein
MGLTSRRTSNSGLLIHDGDELIAEIRSLNLVMARFRPGGNALIGSTVPLPLHWMQYANHEDPNRNAGSHAELTVARSSDDEIALDCKGSTASGACESLFSLRLTKATEPVRYRYAVTARMEVVDESGWLVTPNPSHGEVEFANIWPDGTFVTAPHSRKRYSACYIVRGSDTLRIPHHHLESSDKHLIPMRQGERFLYALEDENLCLDLESGTAATAGVCAYMWDAHVGYKVCTGRKERTLPRGTRFEAEFSLSSIGREEAAAAIKHANDRSEPERSHLPVYVAGVNRFSETLDTSGLPMESAWPWEIEAGPASALSVDRQRGYDDAASLHIDLAGEGSASWKMTALGPAYGQPAFGDGRRYKLSAMVMSEQLSGRGSLSLRLHREGRGSVFNLRDYEQFTSDEQITGSCSWTRLEVLTPPISPPPDRLHLILTQTGRGKTWFDNALLEVI